MIIKKIIYQHRRDFRAIYKCEQCGYEKEDCGYDDRNFHDNVIPKMKCEQCGKSTNDLGIKHNPTPTKYPEGFQI